MLSTLRDIQKTKVLTHEHHHHHHHHHQKTKEHHQSHNGVQVQEVRRHSEAPINVVHPQPSPVQHGSLRVVKNVRQHAHRRELKDVHETPIYYADVPKLPHSEGVKSTRSFDDGASVKSDDFVKKVTKSNKTILASVVHEQRHSASYKKTPRIDQIDDDSDTSTLVDEKIHHHKKHSHHEKSSRAQKRCVHVEELLEQQRLEREIRHRARQQVKEHVETAPRQRYVQQVVHRTPVRARTNSVSSCSSCTSVNSASSVLTASSINSTASTIVDNRSVISVEEAKILFDSLEPTIFPIYAATL